MRSAAWRAIPRVPDARAGDVIAWNFPAWIRTSMTGHVAFVMEPPRVYPGRPNTFALRIADSASVPHDRDTRERGRFRGFGYGDIYVQVDPARGRCGSARDPIPPAQPVCARSN